MSNKKNRSGTSQDDKALTTLRSDYVSVEERSTVDLLMYLRKYAEKVRFYDDYNQSAGFWSEFLAFTDNEVLELAEFAENPDIFSDDSLRLSKYSKPHLALLLTFLKLLQYPKEKFAELTEKNVEYFYKNVLKLKEREEVPDQVHVVFNLARDVREHLLEEGTLLNAGKDNTGVERHYEVREDIVLNKAQVAEVKTIHFHKAITDLKYVHESNNRGDVGFEKILCLVLGNLPNLPPYHTAVGREITVDAVYLRTELFNRIKGRTKDELEKCDAEYIFQSLCFRSLKDFNYCLNLLYRESNRGYVGVTYPEEQEWEKAYRILEEVHKERIARSRRAELKAFHKEYGFESMMEYAFGEPEPRNMLYKMPGNIRTLEELAAADNEAARQYIETKLCMTVEDFRTIMAKKNLALTSVTVEEIYTLLEAAWTKKRGYRYPEIGSEIIEGFYADTIYSADKNDPIRRFAAFGKSAENDSSEDINLGFAVSSPLLRLNEGKREIELVISCQEGTIDYEKIADLLEKNPKAFTTSLSVAEGWREAQDVDFEAGKFIIKPEIQRYDREDSSLVCDIMKYPFLMHEAVGTYLALTNGKVYRIESHDESNSKIYLKTTNLEQPPGPHKWIRRLFPKTFVAELNAALTVSRYARKIKSAVETFDEYHQGRYFVEQQGKIFLINKFINACEVEISYCGELEPEYTGDFSDADRLFLNKVWETIEFEEVETDPPYDLSGLTVSGVYAAEKEFSFAVTDDALKITYPEGATAQELVTAWEAWKDEPEHEAGRYEITGSDEATAQISGVTKDLEKTGEIIKRYESQEEHGLRVTYRGRPVDPADLVIEKPSVTAKQAAFCISGDTLTITPGQVSQTANQIAADWRLWLKEGGNNSQGFQVESKDERLWEAGLVSEEALSPLDRQVKKCEIRNLYGVGIRVLYTGPVADEPKLILEENSIDLFDFAVTEEHVLFIKYPSVSETSAYDLVTAWEEWKASELNDPGNFNLEALGDGLWIIQARTEEELHSTENRIIECTIAKAGVIAGYKLSDDYQNALVQFVRNDNATEFGFEFSDFFDGNHDNLKTKKLTIKYPPLPENPDPQVQNEYQVRHVQSLLSKWNREYNKHGFSLSIIEDNAVWAKDFPEEMTVNFIEDLNYIRTINPNGFVVKFKPAGMDPPFTEIPRAKVVIQENTTDKFAFQLMNDYPNNLKILFIRYPTGRKNRTVAELLKAWKNEDQSLLETGSSYWTEDGELREFQLVSAGTGKWQIKGVTDLSLTTEITTETAFTDPVNQRFFKYQTKDVNGFTLYYTGPEGVVPQVTIVEQESETFAIELFSSYNQFHDVYVGEALYIKYPKRADKRRIIELLTEWYKYKKDLENEPNRILGFEIVDTAPVIKERSKTELLSTGDLVREYQAWGKNGVCFSYIGHREDPKVIMEPIWDFTDEAIGKKILWDNGVIFTVTDRLGKNNVTVDPVTEYIPCYGEIKLFADEALCLEALKFKIRLDEEFPAVGALTGDGYSEDPTIKVLFQGRPVTGETPNGAQDSAADFYDCFKSVSMERIDLSVKVKGLTDIKMRGNIALINPANPFAPFGQTPDVAARFYFANPEICTKKLDSININLNWAENEYLTSSGLPDMEKYYYAYSHCGLDKVGTVKNEDFEVKMQFMDNRIWVPIGEVPQGLFKESWSYHDFSKQTYQGELFTDNPEAPRDPLDWPRYYKMEVTNQGFLKDSYPELVTTVAQALRRSDTAQNTYNTIEQEIKDYEEQIKAAKLAEAEAREKGDDYYQPVIPEARALPSLPENDREIGALVVNSPYTPVIQSMSIDYTASAQLKLAMSADRALPGEIPVRVFRFNPFGYEELEKTDDSDTTDDYLLPQYEHEGYLLLGIRNLAPLQTVSLLFQMVSGSGDLNLSAPEITWSYLADNKWLSFKQSEILKDKTCGLQDTGIISFQIPAVATMKNTVLPPNYCWIRAEAAENVAAVPDVLDIKSGAVCVTYVNRNNDPEHLSKPLAANSITELTTRDSAIREVFQPYTSFNGKRKEINTEFYIRVSERLKHKNRALTLDDYEKLILNRFPRIYKVKCLPQSELEAVESSLFQGEVIVIVILKNSNSMPFFPLKPKAPANLLAEIKRYIQSLMPPQVSVTVKNPRFEEVKYRLAVKFTDGYDQGFYINRLNDDLKAYLSPWAYEKEAEINFGSSIFSSSIINYLENREYVDYIANLCPLQQTIEHKNYSENIRLFLTEDNAVTTKYPDSILVSAENHIIDVITTEFFDPGAFRGIGHMRIGTDFWIDRPGAIFSVGIGEMEIEAWPVLRYAFADVPVKVKVRATVRGEEYEADYFPTWFSRDDSQKIWDLLTEAGYMDEKGNVVTTEDLYADDIRIIDQDGKSLEEFLPDSLSEFTFRIKASDFDPSAGREDEFSYTVQKIYCEGVETAVINILKVGLDFAGISQYPFIVY